MKVLLTLILGLLCFASSANELKLHFQECGYEEIKIEKIATNHDVIKAHINGVEGLFVVDTGANKTVIDRRLLNKYQLQSSDITNSEKAAGAGGFIIIDSYDINTYKLNVKEIQINHIGATDLSAIISGLGQSTGV